MHREIKTYMCNDCQTQYGTKEQLDSHKRKEHYLPKLHCDCSQTIERTFSSCKQQIDLPAYQNTGAQ